MCSVLQSADLPSLLLPAPSSSFPQPRLPHDLGAVLDSSREYFFVVEVEKYSGELVAVFGEVPDVFGGVRMASAERTIRFMKYHSAAKPSKFTQRTFRLAA